MRRKLVALFFSADIVFSASGMIALSQQNGLEIRELSVAFLEKGQTLEQLPQPQTKEIDGWEIILKNITHPKYLKGFGEVTFRAPDEMRIVFMELTIRRKDKRASGMGFVQCLAITDANKTYELGDAQSLQRAYELEWDLENDESSLSEYKEAPMLPLEFKLISSGDREWKGNIFFVIPEEERIAKTFVKNPTSQSKGGVYFELDES